MKKLTLVAIVSIAMYGCASSPASQTYGPYNVVGVGNTCDQAKEMAFRTAVEQSFGTAVMGEKQMKNDVLTRDEVLSHSSGFIEDYKILSTEKNPTGCSIRLSATVRPSMVNKYVFNSASDEKNHNGEVVGAKIKTYNDAKNRSDATLDGLFTDYVNRAYKVRQGKTTYETDAYRNTVMRVHFEVEMNDDFIKALNYTLGKLQDKCTGNCSRVPKFVVKNIPDNSVIPKFNHYFFADMQTPLRVNDLLLGECKHPWHVQVKMYNSVGNVIYTTISEPYQQVPNVYTEDNGWGKELNTIFWVHSADILIPTTNFSLSELKRIEVSLLDTTKKINGECL